MVISMEARTSITIARYSGTNIQQALCSWAGQFILHFSSPGMTEDILLILVLVISSSAGRMTVVAIISLTLWTPWILGGPSSAFITCGETLPVLWYHVQVIGFINVNIP